VIDRTTGLLESLEVMFELGPPSWINGQLHGIAYRN
jgi:hypothetical protein